MDMMLDDKRKIKILVSSVFVLTLFYNYHHCYGYGRAVWYNNKIQEDGQEVANGFIQLTIQLRRG